MVARPLRGAQPVACMTSTTIVPTGLNQGGRLRSRSETRLKVVAPAGNISNAACSFIGRNAALATLRDAIARGQRLITIMGPPGVGKTTVAQQLGRELRDLDGAAWPGGIWFCDLADARDATDVREAVSGLLAVDPAALGPALIVLDNLEQVVGSAGELLMAWLRQAPQIVWVTTSRERLRLEGESVVDLGPLSADEALTLWVDRVQAVNAAYMGNEDLDVVRELLDDLDRVPHAIELAASRMNMLDAPALKRGLSARFELLSRGRRGTTDRHASLQAALEWSWRLLKPWERVALMDCSTFCGTFTVEAAQQVVKLDEDPACPGVFETLHALRDQSLLSREARDTRVRLRLSASVREYAAAQLRGCGREADAHARHARTAVEAAERHAAVAMERGCALAVAAIHDDRANISAAATRRSHAEPAMALRALTALTPAVMAYGPLSEHLARLDEALEDWPSIAVLSETVVLATLARGRCRLAEGRVDKAAADFLPVLEAARILELPHARAQAVLGMARCALRMGENAAAVDSFTLARDLHVGSARWSALASSGVGYARALCGEASEGRTLMLRAIDRLRALGDLEHEAIATLRLGAIELELGRHLSAKGRLARVLSIANELQHDGLRADALSDLGLCHHVSGNASDALAVYEEALPLYITLGARLGAARLRVRRSMAQLEEGDGHGAERGLRRAMAELEALGDKAGLASAHARLGYALCELGHTDDADHHFTCAGADHLHGLLSGRLDLELAVMSSERGDAERCKQLLAGVQHKVRSDGSDGPEVRLVKRLLRRALQRRATLGDSGDADAVVAVQCDGTAFRVGSSPPVSCGRYRAVCRVLAALARCAVDRPGVALTPAELVGIAWPGESMQPGSAKNRLQVTLSKLRKLGMRSALMRNTTGYLLDPTAGLLLVSELG